MKSKASVRYLQVLSVVTVVESLSGLTFVALGAGMFRFVQRHSGWTFPHFGLAYFGLLFANCLFLILLLISAGLLWRLNRTGLFLMIAALVSELVFFAWAGHVIFPLQVRDCRSRDLMMGAAGLGSAFLSALLPQIYTAYPIVAGILLFLGYPSLRAPGGSGDLSTTAPKDSHPTNKKTIVLFRILAVLTGLEDGIGLCSAALFAVTFPLVNTSFRAELPDSGVLSGLPHLRLIFWSMSALNFIFIGFLLRSAVLLWRLLWRGALLLIAVLCCEVLYFLLLRESSAFLHSAGDGLPKTVGDTLATLGGAGNMGLSIQILTAFPLIAGVLILLLYLNLGSSEKGHVMA